MSLSGTSPQKVKLLHSMFIFLSDAKTIDTREFDVNQ